MNQTTKDDAIRVLIQELQSRLKGNVRKDYHALIAIEAGKRALEADNA